MSRESGTRWALSALLAGALSVACGGGGGGGPTQPPPPPSGISFTTSQPATSSSLFLTQGGATNPNRLFLEVRVSEVEDFYGVAFDLVYPSSLLDFAAVTENNFLRGRTDLQTSERTAGRIIIGHTNLGDDPPESGSGLLMTLEFTPVANGSGAMRFDNEQAFTRGSVPYTIQFIGGNVSVRR